MFSPYERTNLNIFSHFRIHIHVSNVSTFGPVLEYSHEGEKNRGEGVLPDPPTNQALSTT